MERTPLQKELKQERPFPSPAQEAVVGILRTADVIKRRAGEVMRSRGITLQQYNVLRILRGSAPDPLPTLEIADRMIERTPGVTRLLDRLDTKGWVRRERCPDDRRIVHCWISPAGLDLLAEMDGVIEEADREALGDLSPDEAEALSRLLDRVRGDTQ